MSNEGLSHIHNLMHVFIEGCAAGIYDNIEDVQRDATEYLNMEKVVSKLSNWNENSKVEDLVNIFEGAQNSKAVKKCREQEKDEWTLINTNPSIEDIIGKQE